MKWNEKLDIFFTFYPKMLITSIRINALCSCTEQKKKRIWALSDVNQKKEEKKCSKKKSFYRKKRKKNIQLIFFSKHENDDDGENSHLAFVFFSSFFGFICWQLISLYFFAFLFDGISLFCCCCCCCCLERIHSSRLMMIVFHYKNVT